MKFIPILAGLILITLLVVPVGFASTVTDATSMTVTANGPSGILMPLGIENFLPLSTALGIYNLMGALLLVLFAAIASPRDERWTAIFLIIMGGVFGFFGWLNGTSAMAVVVGCSLLVAVNYVTATNREKFGTRGQGSLVMNIAVFIIALQMAYVVINVGAVIPSSVAVSNQTSEWSNVDLGTKITSLSNEGGIIQAIADISTVIGDMALSGIRILINIVAALALFSAVLYINMPWLQGNGMAIAILTILQAFIYIVYALFLFNIGWKPFGEPIHT